MYIQTNEKGIKVTSPEKSWRLTHDGAKVLSLNEHIGILRVSNEVELFVATTKEECDAEIASLKLIKLVEIEKEKV